MKMLQLNNLHCNKRSTILDYEALVPLLTPSWHTAIVCSAPQDTETTWMLAVRDQNTHWMPCPCYQESLLPVTQLTSTYSWFPPGEAWPSLHLQYHHGQACQSYNEVH